MSPEDRKIVNRDQTIIFFNSYYYLWRVNHIFALEKLFSKRFDFFADIIDETKQADDQTGESTIAQEVGNGLYFEAISASAQYIEDLFALLNAAQKPDYFVRNILSYRAGKITELISKHQNKMGLCKLFYFPFDNDDHDLSSVGVAYRQCMETLHSSFLEIQEYHAKINFFYNQYKHGLTIALRPYKVYSHSQILLMKNMEGNHYLMAFDSLAVDKFKNFRDPRLNGIALFPNLTPSMLANFSELQGDNNLIRFVRVPEDITFPYINQVVIKTKILIETFINNFMGFVKDDFTNLRLPSLDLDKAVFFNFQENPFTKIKKK